MFQYALLVAGIAGGAGLFFGPLASAAVIAIVIALFLILLPFDAIMACFWSLWPLPSNWKAASEVMYRRRVLVLGANTGIGYGIAQHAIDAQASKLVVVCRSNLEETVSKLRKYATHVRSHTKVVGVYIDLTVPSSITAATAAAAKVGPYDIVYVNAGLTSHPPRCAQTNPQADVVVWTNWFAVNAFTAQLIARGAMRGVASRSIDDILAAASAASSDDRAVTLRNGTAIVVQPSAAAVADALHRRARRRTPDAVARGPPPHDNLWGNDHNDDDTVASPMSPQTLSPTPHSRIIAPVSGATTATTRAVSADARAGSAARATDGSGDEGHTTRTAPTVTAAPPPRSGWWSTASDAVSSLPRPVIVFTSSDSHRWASYARPRFGAYQYSVLEQTNHYAYSKLLNQIMANAWARALAGVVDVYGACPGPVATDIVRDAPFLLAGIARAVTSIYFQSPRRGAAHVVYAAGNDAASGSYYWMSRRVPQSRDATSLVAGREMVDVFAEWYELCVGDPAARAVCGDDDNHTESG